jgi:two-component system invasion response regulator UvrY
MQKELIKVAMVDDHILLRNALSSLINNTGKCKVIYEASNGKELIEKIKRETKPDVVILDLNMPEMNGHETAVYLQENYPEINVLMLTMYDSELALIRLLKAGVKGFMKKDIHPSELIYAIESVFNNGYYYSAHTSSKLAGLFRNSTDNSKTFDKIMLSDVELEFMNLVCSELTYKEIASELKLNPRAIDGIRDGLFTRLEVKSRVGLAMYSIKNGIVQV